MANVRRGGAVQDEILDYVRKSEESIIDAGRKWTDSIAELVPGDARGMRKLVDDAFDLTEAILKTQRQFVHSVLDALRRFEVPGREVPAAKPKAAAPRKPATRRAPARKPSGTRRTRAA